MMKKSLLTFMIFFFCRIAEVGFTPLRGAGQEQAYAMVSYDEKFLYTELLAGEDHLLPSPDLFSLALKGFSHLKLMSDDVKKEILTIIDFSLPSNKKRLWVIDLKNKKVLFNDLVAHGKNSGIVYAGKFSNTESTYMSSLGFYVTGPTYQGKHGLSLILEGMDEGFNDNARERAIVMHGADYVCDEFIRKHGRLGRSFGCPAISTDICKKVIDTIRDGSCLFIYYPDKQFLAKSQVLNLAGQLSSHSAKLK